MIATAAEAAGTSIDERFRIRRQGRLGYGLFRDCTVSLLVDTTYAVGNGHHIDMHADSSGRLWQRRRLIGISWKRLWLLLLLWREVVKMMVELLLLQMLRMRRRLLN